MLLVLFSSQAFVISTHSTSYQNSSSRATRDSQQNANFTGNYQIQQNFFYYIPVSLENTSYLIYSTFSNTTISTAVMNPFQLQLFNQTGSVSNSALDQNGTLNVNALLLTRGTYYLILFAYQAPANATYFYEINSNVTVQNSTTFVGEVITLAPQNQLTVPIHLETLGSPSKLEVFGVSNQSVSYQLLNSNTQTTVFSSANPETVTNLSLTAQGNVSLGYNVTLPQGSYTLYVSNPSTISAAYVYFEYQLLPSYVNPYLTTLLHPLPPAPTGIAAFGIYNNSGTITPYDAEGSSVIGYVNISSMVAQNPNRTSDTNANLQMNAILQVTDTDGSTFTYWPQNVMWYLNTSSSGGYVLYRNNILNMTGDGASLRNSTIMGTGFVSTDPQSGASYYGNYNSTYLYTYKFPLVYSLYMNETIQPKVGVWVYTGIQLLANGSLTNNNTILWFDKILIVDPNATSASFEVSGNRYLPVGANTPLGLFFDTELVFGGDLGGQSAVFSSLGAKLSLFYYNQTIRTYPSVYAFGGDTAESAFNLQSTYGGNSVTVSTNQSPSFGLLTNNYTSSLAALEGKLGPGTSSQSSSSSSTTTSSSTSVSSIVTTSSSQSQLSTSSTSSSSTAVFSSTVAVGPVATSTSSSSLPFASIGIALVVIIFLGAVAAIALSRRKKPSNDQMNSTAYTGTSPPATSSPVSPSSPQQNPPAVLYCGNCGMQNTSADSFCRRCGASLAHP